MGLDDQPAAGAERPQPAAQSRESEPGRARLLGAHVLRMFETRMDAAAIAIEYETQSLATRLRLRLFAVGAIFMAVWAGIVLLAVALPDPWRVPVLAGVVAAFAIGAIVLQVRIGRRVEQQAVGSMRWFVDGLRADVEVLARALAPEPPQNGAENPDAKANGAHRDAA
jgi:uncharacterized membrane protein YqjE